MHNNWNSSFIQLTLAEYRDSVIFRWGPIHLVFSVELISVLYFHKIIVLIGPTSLRGSLLSYYRYTFGHPAVKANLIWITAIFTAGIFTPSALTLFVHSRCSGPRRIILISVFCPMPSLTSCHWRGDDIMDARAVLWAMLPSFLRDDTLYFQTELYDRNTIYDCYQRWWQMWKCSFLINPHQLMVALKLGNTL